MMDNNKKMVPRIRFRGFEGNWKEIILGEIAQRVTEKNRDNKYSDTFTNSAEWGIVDQNQYFDKQISNRKNLSSYYVVKPNDFVYNPRISKQAPYGPIRHNGLDRIGVMSPLYLVFRLFEADSLYLEYYFKSTRWYKFMYKNGDSGARADRFAIKDNVFFQMPIKLPLRIEQRKVGLLLKKIDHLIVETDKVVSDTRKLKQLLLRNIFDLVWRFEGFNDPWEQRKLGKLVRELDKKVLGSLNLPIATSSRSGLWLQKDYFDRSDEKNQNTVMFHLLPKGFITYRHMSDDAKFHFNQNNFSTDVLVSKEYPVFSAIVPRDQKFILYYLNNSSSFAKFALEQKKGGTRTRLYFKNLKSFSLKVPEKSQERQNIGDLFFEFDNLIVANEKKLDQLKQLKKYLMQNMFV
ncbi:restriction endonuclease subunit S [Levilactobacillus tujiorum]|uniref:restriction endonuclease subunit S n=1 Tax=Levilactobacillus tujiorum TaxID=2912243 RepID=UPI001456F90F|nr:restriction endonuclease subunit S [Levilactobacillus tujiorum]NLR32497.1 restriction endonuclease subunit S [Levilactobacillus tujiorum]